jgi:hypothetical protein
MRKLFCMGAASLVASATFVYLAADYAVHHPESWLARNITACIRPPMPGIVRIPPPSAPAGQPAVAHPEESLTKLTIQPEPEECPETPSCPPAVEASEPIQVGAPSQTAESPAVKPVSACGIVSSAMSETPADVQTSPAAEDTAYMPPCPTVEGQQDVPDHMPYVDEDPEMGQEAGCPFDAWFQWLHQQFNKKEGNPDQSEADLVPAEASSPDAPACPPDCREDPEYPNQYSGCPHMNGCPMCPYCPAPAIHPETPPAKKHRKKLKIDPMSFLRKANPPGADVTMGVEPIAIFGVDTMECRPSDSHITLKPKIQ